MPFTKDDAREMMEEYGHATHTDTVDLVMAAYQRGVDSMRQKQTETPLWGRPVIDITKCGCDDNIKLKKGEDCGCAFGQCAKGLIY